MPLVAQRFAAQPTLQKCVDDEPPYRLHAGEADHAAVLILQEALEDLGYDVGGLDGIFGGNTGTAVSAFKSEEGLSPSDPVVARGTMSRLDSYFSHEPADPDTPDPKSYGLTDLAVAAMATATKWVDTALFALELWRGDLLPDQPAWVDYDASLHRNFHIDRSAMDRAHVIGRVILPAFHAVKRAMQPPDHPAFDLVSMDREGWSHGNPGSSYPPAVTGVAGQLFLLPPFRNVLTDEQRAAEMIRFAVSADDHFRVFAVPGSRRYENLPHEQGLQNQVAYAAFAYEMKFGGIVSFIRPHYSWRA